MTATPRKLEPEVSNGQPWVLPVFALLCWGLAVRHLSLEWSLNEQYHYGWLVPLLALYLLRLRLETMPAAGPVRSSWIVGWGVLIIAAAEALLIPLREANADWRLLGAVLTGLAALATLLAFFQAGGLRWLWHFAFPVLFMFTAVPWPRKMEFDIMHGLMQHNALLAAEGLHWLGVNAVVQGSLIRLSSLTVDIDEACSGIRSLQGALMATLFIGEIFELKRWQRVFLLLIGACWALVTNAARTLFLSLVTERDGMEGYDRWHDPAGYWILGVCVAGVTLAGWLMRHGKTATSRSVHGHASVAWLSRLAAPSRAAFVGIALIGASGLATEAWFRSQNAAITEWVNWTFNQPADITSFVSVEQAGRVRSELRYDVHSGGRWADAEGRRWVAHYFRWDPGIHDPVAALSHDPRHCLGATGKELVQVLPTVNYEASGVVLPFDAYWFRELGENVFVFNAMVEDVRHAPGQEQNLTRTIATSSRLQAVWDGRRNQGKRRLEVAVWGERDASLAVAAFERLLRTQVVVEVKGAPENTGG